MRCCISVVSQQWSRCPAEAAESILVSIMSAWGSWAFCVSLMWAVKPSLQHTGEYWLLILFIRLFSAEEHLCNPPPPVLGRVRGRHQSPVIHTNQHRLQLHWQAVLHTHDHKLCSLSNSPSHSQQIHTTQRATHRPMGANGFGASYFPI